MLKTNIKLINTIEYYFRIWLMMCKNSFLIYLNNRTILTIFLTGKILRFVLFFAFLFYLVTGVKSLSGYSVDQTIFFFITFNIIDVMSQFLFREVYRFRSYIVSGDFDHILVKPMNPLFRVLFGGADFVDLITIPPLLYIAYTIGSKILVSPVALFYYLLLIISGILISAAFYIVVLSLAIITFEIDHSVMIFRDLTKLGSIPIDVYKEPLRFVLTYIIPVGVMISVPAKVFMGFTSFSGSLASFLVAGVGLYLSLRFWDIALKKYSSASS